MGLYEFEGKRPLVGEGAFVHPEAATIGGVTIGDGCYIGVGAVLRGDWADILVGPGPYIQENCVLRVRPGEITVLGQDSHIGHRAIIHGAGLGRHVMVDGCAVIHDGVVIGDDVLIGTGCVFPGDQTIPEGKMALGVPGRIVGEAPAEQKAVWRTGLQLYQAPPDRCREGLRAA